MPIASPYWSYPGIRNGRITPTMAAGQGSATGEYYYFYYSYYSDRVFCLGADISTLPDSRLKIGDTPAVRQINVDLTDIDLLYFCWYLRTSTRMPAFRNMAIAGPFEVYLGRALGWDPVGGAPVDDTVPAVAVPYDTAHLFVEDDAEHLVTIAGSAFNDGTFVLTGVPKDTGPRGRVQAQPAANQYYNGQVGVIDNPAALAEVVPLANLQMLGLRWVARATVDGILRCELVEHPGRAWQRNQLCMHVSKLAGMHTIGFELRLEAVES